MESSLLQRISESLRGHKRDLTSWLRAEPPARKAIRLGDRPEQDVREHLSVVERALQEAESGLLGRCTVCHEQIESHWLETNYTHCVCLEHLSGEQRARLESELELSQKVQQALLPQSVPAIPGWEVAAFSQPASIVGGDYFDFLRFRGGEHALLVADVMGKGVPASMLMASLQASLRIIIPESDAPDRALLRANDLFYHNIRLTKFVSIVVAQIEPGSGTVRYANAGHHPPLLVRQGAAAPEKCFSLRPTGAAIGLVEHASFTLAQVEVFPGDFVVFYTDGVVEAVRPGGEEYGEEHLKEYLAAHSDLNAGELLRGIRDDVARFTGGRPLADDATILVCKRSAQPAI